MILLRQIVPHFLLFAVAAGVLCVHRPALAQPVEVISIDSAWRMQHTDGEAATSPWMKPAFDDHHWLRHRGPFFPGTPEPGGHGHSENGDLQHLQVRARFVVKDPQAVEKLKLSFSYRGGAVVYLNGHAVHRADLPEGCPMRDGILATAYTTRPALSAPRDEESARQVAEARLRHVTDAALPAHLLRPGVNVLAVHVRRADGPPQPERRRNQWAMLGLQRLSLKAEASSAEAIVPNIGRPPGTQVWTALPIEDVGGTLQYPCATEVAPNTAPIRLIAARNMTVSGQAVVSADEPVDDVEATVNDFHGRHGVLDLPSGAVRIRYAASSNPEMEKMGYAMPRPDVLQAAPDGREALQPIWLTVTVPADAPAGTYHAALTIEADGLEEAVDVPVELVIHGWDCPAPHDWRIMVSMIQSPHSVAWHYGVLMWSERHLELLEPSLSLLGKLGNNTLYVDVIHPSFFAPEHGVIVFQRDGERLVPDFTYFDRLLDAYAQAAGVPRRINLVIWERGIEHHGVTVSVRKPNGDLQHVNVGEYADAEDMWKAMMDGVRRRILQRGWDERSIMIGVGQDNRPSAQTIAFFNEIAPYARWTLFTHGRGDPRIDADGRQRIGEMNVGYLEYPYYTRTGSVRIDAWITGLPREEIAAEDRRSLPRGGLLHGGVADWHACIKALAGRYQLNDNSPAERYRLFPGTMVMGTTQGFCRHGLDKWPVINPHRPDTGRGRMIEGASGWGPLHRGLPRAIAAPGPDGALATVRFEMLREGLQDTELRIFLERALTDPRTRDILGEDLLHEVQSLIATQWELHGPEKFRGHPVAGADWLGRQDRWYAAAALAQSRLEAAGKDRHQLQPPRIAPR